MWVNAKGSSTGSASVSGLVCSASRRAATGEWYMSRRLDIVMGFVALPTWTETEGPCTSLKELLIMVQVGRDGRWLTLSELRYGL